MTIPQDKFLCLVNLVLTTTWYIFKFYQQTDDVAIGGPASSTAAEIYMQAHEQYAISTALHTLQKFGKDLLKKFHKIRPTFYTENTLCKLLCKTKAQAATEEKNKIASEIDSSNCIAVYFGESKRSLKSRSNKQKEPVRKCD